MSNYTGISISFRGLVTHQQYAFILELYCEALTIHSFIGIVSNIINIRTFCAMGLTDGITVSFLSMSLIDLAYMIASFLLGISVALTVIEKRTHTTFSIDPHGVNILLANVIVLVNVTNVLTTTFIAVARCMCVAKPLHFKNWFTIGKTLAFIFSCVIASVVSYAPVLANMGIVRQFDLKKNITRPTLWFSSKQDSVKIMTGIVIEMMLPFATQFIVVICVLIMTYNLRLSAKFRQSAALVSENFTSGLDQKQNVTLSSTSTVSTNKLVGKDVRVVQQVVLISLVYIICNTPKMMLSLAAITVPDFNFAKRYSNLYLSVNMLRQQFDMFNSSVNTFIYYRYNTKFRMALQSWFK
ncbi:hypothetical protein BsWGS_12767 [Bradybaena similaris]